MICSVYKLGFADDMSTEAIENRIKPIGEVNIKAEMPAKTDTSPVADQTTKATNEQNQNVQATETGKEIYDQYCTICHANGVAGAPKFRDEADWKARQVQGMDVLLEHATQGYNMMPPMGTCSTCTQEQLQDAIKYMLPS